MHVVSVIVPVYNICKYVQICIDSLLQQTYTNLQIILVDDGSVDGSEKVCDEAAAKDCRIQVIHKKNEGLSSARNAGMEKAYGDYLLFIDGDDWIEPYAVERLLELAVSHDADVVAFGISVDYVNERYSTIIASQTEMDESVYTKQQMVYALSEIGLVNSACIKMYRKDYISAEKNYFIIGMEPIEDILFNAKLFSGNCRIVISPDAFYHYMKRDINSMVTKYRENIYEISEMRSEAFQEMFDKNDLSDELSKAFLYKEYLIGKSDCILNCYREGSLMSAKERTELIRQVVSAEKFKNAKRNCVHIKTFPINILLRLSFLSPELIRLCYDFLFFLRRHFRKIYSIYRKKKGEKNGIS